MIFCSGIKKLSEGKSFVRLWRTACCFVVVAIISGGSQILAKDGTSPVHKQIGRIEELVEQTGASPPMVLQKEEPQFDVELGEPPKPVFLQGQVLNSYPRDWRGAWSGKVQVVRFDMNPAVWKGDPLTTFRMKSLLRPGKEGSLTVVFKEDQNKNLYLDPPQIDFKVFARSDPFSVILNDSSSSGEDNAGAIRKHGMFTLSFGGFSGVGLSGNVQNNEVLKDRIARLNPAVIEQDIFTRGQSINRFTKEATKGYFETVLQLEALDEERLAINAASVCYYETGIFEYKLVVEGILQREQPGAGTESGGKP